MFPNTKKRFWFCWACLLILRVFSRTSGSVVCCVTRLDPQNPQRFFLRQNRTFDLTRTCFSVGTGTAECISSWSWVG